MSNDAMVFKGTSNGRQFIPADTRYFVWLAAHKDMPLDVTMARETKARSSKQMRYYFGVIIKMLSEHLGYPKEMMHDIIGRRFLTEMTPEGFLYTKSTKMLTTMEQETLHEDIRRWASVDLKDPLYIPHPNEDVCPAH
jgi:hypothetical protein